MNPETEELVRGSKRRGVIGIEGRTEEGYGWRRGVAQAGSVFMIVASMICQLADGIELYSVLLRETLYRTEVSNGTLWRGNL